MSNQETNKISKVTISEGATSRKISHVKKARKTTKAVINTTREERYFFTNQSKNSFSKTLAWKARRKSCEARPQWASLEIFILQKSKLRRCATRQHLSN